MKRKIIFITLIFILISCTYLIITGSPLLGNPVIKGCGLPFGTMITWLGISSLPLSIYFGIDKIYNANTKPLIIYRLILRIIITLSLLWGIVSFLLAGNWASVFSQKSGFRGSANAATYFLGYTLFIVIIPHIFLLTYVLNILITTIKKRT